MFLLCKPLKNHTKFGHNKSTHHIFMNSILSQPKVKECKVEFINKN